MQKVITLPLAGLAVLAIPALFYTTVHADTQTQHREVVRARQVDPAVSVGEKVQYKLDNRQRHIVWGDTLSQLAIDEKTNMTAIADYNHIADPNVIYAGDNLLIPVVNGTPTRTYVVQQGDTIDSVATKTGVDRTTILLNSHLVSEELTPGQTLILDRTL